MIQQAQSQTIESLDLNVNKMMADFYVVPSYQREYVWTERHVEQLLQDVFDEFPETAASQSVEYFIGSVVVCPGEDGTLDLIDGQQRMTTLFLIMCAIRDHLRDLGAPPLDTIANQISATSIDDHGLETKRFRVSLQYEDSADILERVGMGESITDRLLPRTRSVTNIQRAYECIRAFLVKEFGANDAEARRFYAYLINHVKIVRIRTQSVAHALKVFETVNDRGIGLDAMDLLKNLMFMSADRAQYEKLKNLWKELVDTLFEANEKPLRFLRYYILARYPVEGYRLREDQIYRWFSKNEAVCGFGQEPVGFVLQLRDAARAYTNFAGGKNADGSPNRYLSNIYALSYAARQHHILLLAGMQLQPVDFIELCRHLENLFFAYNITREPTKDFERLFATWAPELRSCSDWDDLQSFLKRYFDPAKERLAARFEFALGELTENAVPRYPMRYIIGKLAQHVNEAAYGPGEADLGLFVKEQDVEHILPQTPSQELIHAFDEPDQYWAYVPRLGNLTLLENGINQSVSNKPFAQKRLGYAKSHFLITRTIAEPIELGNTKIDRSVAGLSTFETWDSTAVERRQEMLVALAHKVWEIPKGT